MIFAPKILEGRFVRLEPYAPHLREEVQAALNCDPESWRLFTACGHGEHFDLWWREALAGLTDGSRIDHAVRRLADGRVIGSTSFLDIRPADRGLEIGSTFYVPEARGTAVNPECKRLLLARAFETGAARVQIVADVRNLRSQAAVAKLGAAREGVLRRNKRIWTGRLRDTVVYAVVEEDWPQVRAGLDARLAAFAAR